MDRARNPPRCLRRRPPVTPVTVDGEVQRGRDRERRRAAGREGRQSTLLTGGIGARRRSRSRCWGSDMKRSALYVAILRALGPWRNG